MEWAETQTVDIKDIDATGEHSFTDNKCEHCGELEWQLGDIDHDGDVDDRDAYNLLRHTMMPERYPLTKEYSPGSGIYWGIKAVIDKYEYSVEGPITVKPSTSNAGKQNILCVCGAKTVKTLPQMPADLDDVPKTGDVTIQITMGVAAMISMAAAAAFVFKRKIAK